MMNEDELSDPKWFPNYLILRRQVGSEGQDGEHWQGFVKEIKNSYERSIISHEISLDRSMNLLHNRTTFVVKKDIEAIKT
jgi:hypothetical protein